MTSVSRSLRPFTPVRFGRYTLVTPIATGGMGAVYLGKMGGVEGFEKLVVIKKILPQFASDEEFVARFVNEAKLLVKLHHGSVAQVLEMGVEDGEYYIAMEFVDGKDLRKLISRCQEQKQPMPVGLALYVMVRLLDALAYAHRKKGDDDRELNLVHRDVSPQNVLVSYEGEVKVIDFGLAKSSLSLSRTNPSMILGKFFYMSPEQARHQKLDRRSDLYAAGICLWELLVGKNPFDDLAPGEIMAVVGSPKIPNPRVLRPELPESIADACMKALAVARESRYATAEEMRGKLTACMIEADPGAGPEALASWMRQQFAREYEAERRAMAALVSVQPGAPTADHDEDDDEPERFTPRRAQSEQGLEQQQKDQLKNITAAAPVISKDITAQVRDSAIEEIVEKAPEPALPVEEPARKRIPLRPAPITGEPEAAVVAPAIEKDPEPLPPQKTPPPPPASEQVKPPPPPREAIAPPPESSATTWKPTRPPEVAAQEDRRRRRLIILGLGGGVFGLGAMLALAVMWPQIAPGPSVETPAVVLPVAPATSPLTAETPAVAAPVPPTPAVVEPAPVVSEPAAAVTVPAPVVKEEPTLATRVAPEKVDPPAAKEPLAPKEPAAKGIHAKQPRVAAHPDDDEEELRPPTPAAIEKGNLERLYRALNKELEDLQKVYPCERIGMPCTQMRDIVKVNFENAINAPALYPELRKTLTQFGGQIEARRKFLQNAPH